MAQYVYSGIVLSYERMQPDGSNIVHTANPNSTLDYLDEQLGKIPLADQIKVSGLDRFVVSYQPHTVIPEGTPIFDGRNNAAFPVLDQQAYNAGSGGVSDGNTNVVIRLFDGMSTIEGQQYLYAFDPAEAETATGNQQSTMQCDYAISGETLRFTKDYGQSWIESDLTEEELAETLEFYRNGLLLPPESLFVSADAELPIAFFFGGAPTLKMTFDDGASWTTVPLSSAAEFGRAITKRAIGFTSPDFAYAALGTDWSMGAGEHKLCYFSFDGGTSWTEKELPLTMTSSTLADIAMADERNGIVALNDGMDGSYPVLYATSDTGDTWHSVQLPYGDLPPKVQYLSTIDSLVYEDGWYLMTLGQGNSGTAKASFASADLFGPWKLAETFDETIHLVG